MTLHYEMKAFQSGLKQYTTPSYLAASYNVLALYPFVPLTQYGMKKIMKMTVFLFSKFDRLPFFLTPELSDSVKLLLIDAKRHVLEINLVLKSIL